MNIARPRPDARTVRPVVLSRVAPLSLPVLLFLAGLALYLPEFFPNLRDINLFDEAIYVTRGRWLVENSTWPELAYNPLVAVLYALAYWFVRESDWWLIHANSFGRLAMFALLWLGCSLVARRLSRLAPPAVTLSLLAVSPALAAVIRNPSDGLFAAIESRSKGTPGF